MLLCHYTKIENVQNLNHMTKPTSAEHQQEAMDKPQTSDVSFFVSSAEQRSKSQVTIIHWPKIVFTELYANTFTHKKTLDTTV